MRTVILFFIGYGLFWWGNTLLMGGPDGTGAWPFWYAMFKIGSGPVQATASSLNNSQLNGNPYTVSA
jgi:hypothetical protein